jgi:hypothetical protein
VGLFKNMNDLYKAGGEPMKPGSSADRVSGAMANAKASMAAAQEMLAQQTRSANLAMTGEDATATVIEARQTSQAINFDPVLELDVHVMADGRPPYPVTLRQSVPQLYLAKVQPGATVKAKIDPADPSSVFLDLVSP